MAEGAPLLREYGVLSLIKGSNPFVSAKLFLQAVDLKRLFSFLLLILQLVPALVPILVFVVADAQIATDESMNSSMFLPNACGSSK